MSETAKAVNHNRRRLGERLRAVREAIVRSGVPLLDEDGVERELTDRVIGQLKPTEETNHEPNKLK